MIITVDMIISGFVSKVVNDCGDILKNKIRDADKHRESKGQTMETKIYQVIIDALNGFTYNEHKGEERVYDAAESMLKRFKDSKDNYKEAVGAGLCLISPKVTGDICEEFLEGLHYEICKDKNNILYKEIEMLWRKMIDGNLGEIVKNQKDGLNMLVNISENTDYVKSFFNIHKTECDNKIYIKNRAEEYADKWNCNVFLNNFSERDEKAGTNIKLKDIYLEEFLPNYIWKENKGSSNDLRALLSEYLVDNDGKKMLLILGQPGIGKSTLITWIMANLVKNPNNVLVYQFASDLYSIDWQSKNVLNEMFSTMGLEYDELESKTIILDGFDEVYIGSDREGILNRLNHGIKHLNKVKVFSMIITCRENYIYNLQNVKCDYITLRVWNERQIEFFCREYWGKCGNNLAEDNIQKILLNKEIFGIPLILYMILALNITIEKSSSIVDVYDQIFSVKRGGIYDRCYSSEHRINRPETKKCVHQITQRMAFWIFENNADKAFIYQRNFKEICNNVMVEMEDKSDGIQSNTLIGNYFKIKHCEGQMADEVNFIHRSIYEYFVAVYFFESIQNLTSEEKIAGQLGELLKEGCLSEQILEFMKCKFDSKKELNLSDISKKIFNIMLRDGMAYYTKERYKSIIEREMNIFSNMLKIVHLWNHKLGGLDNKIVFYLQHSYLNESILCGVALKGANLGGTYLNKANLIEADLGRANLNGAVLSRANLERADLSDADLSGADLSEANLSEANLSGANLRKADLGEANLSKSDLSGANLRRADLSGANLSEVDLSSAYLRNADLKEANLYRADLSGAYLTEADLSGVNLSEAIFSEWQIDILDRECDLSRCRVVLAETNEIMEYSEYYIRKQKT